MRQAELLPGDVVVPNESRIAPWLVLNMENGGITIAKLFTGNVINVDERTFALHKNTPFDYDVTVLRNGENVNR